MIVLLISICAVPVILALVLALPWTEQNRNWPFFFKAAAKVFFGIVVPLLVFFAGALLAPDSKSQSQHGWLDSFHIGKLALTPLVLFACAAFHMAEINPADCRIRPWMALGLFNGAFVAAVCLAFGILNIVDGEKEYPALLFMIVPGYVAVWYLLRAVQLTIRHHLDLDSWPVCLFGSLPFWLASYFWSNHIYLSLPDVPPKCFVVTAASQGHPGLVGLPTVDIVHRGRWFSATLQLATLWKFEVLWQRRAPRSHAWVRLIYNRVGPMIASRITNVWTADLAYIAIKPVELFAWLILRLARSRS